MRVTHVIVGVSVCGAELMLKRLIESYANDSQIKHDVLSLRGTGTIDLQMQNVGGKEALLQK